MPRQRRKAPRRNRRKRRPRAVTLSTRQARTKKYDSRIEKVIARVARQEDQKAKDKLIYRQYLFGSYDMDLNTWASQTRIDFDGEVAPLCQIQLMDGATMVTQVPSVNNLQTPSTYINPGVNVIGAATVHDGFRRGHVISIHGITLDLRATLPLLASVGTPRYEHATLYWKLCAVMYEGSDLVDAKPTAEACGRMVPLFGFSSKLDQDQFNLLKDIKVKTFAEGKMRLRCSTLSTDLKRMRRYIDLSAKPQKVFYTVAEQNGRRVERWKPFLVLRSDIPVGQQFQDYHPRVNACTKIHYTDTPN